MNPQSHRIMNTKPLRYLVSALLVTVICLTPGSASLSTSAYLPEGTIERVSVAADGTQGNVFGSHPDRERLSEDGRYVVFSSSASTPVPGDTNGHVDVFLVDRMMGQIKRISMGLDGNEANGDSYVSDMTPSGRYIVFFSKASNLVKNDTNGWGDVFVYDQQSGSIARVSLSNSGMQADNHVSEGVISDDGSQVAFTSVTKVFAGETDADLDVFVRDRDTDNDGIFDEADSVRTFRVSIGADKSEPDTYNNARVAISGDGRFVSFCSDSKNLVSPPDSDSYYDVFVLDRDYDENGIFDEETTGGTKMIKVSVDPDGNTANGDSYLDVNAPMSADGRYITFSSSASNLVTGDGNGKKDIFVRDMQTGLTTLVSYGPEGVWALGDSYAPDISSDGRYIAFQTAADNLVSGDDNGWDDCLIHDNLTGENTRASLAWDGSQGNKNSENCSLSANGLEVVFVSTATNLVSDDTNADKDAFVFERVAQATVTPGAGGSLSISRELQASATFPPGAVAETVNVRMNWDSGPAGPVGAIRLGNPFTLEAYDSGGNPVTSFMLPFTIQMNYQDQHVSGMAEDTLTAYFYDPVELRWKSLLTTVNAGANQITFNVNHLTLFAVFGQSQAEHSIYLPLVIK